MTFRVEWTKTGYSSMSTYMGRASAEETEKVFTAIDALAGNPAPEQSRPWGPDYRRLHLGNWRVLYRVDTGAAVIYVKQVGRVRDNNGK